MTYKPNWADPRVRSRATQAYGFVRGVVSTTKPRAWSTRYIDKFLGQQTTQLSKYLRRLLLITTNNHWSIEQKQCKEYLANATGLEFLAGILNEEPSTPESCDFDNNYSTYPIVYDLNKPDRYRFDLRAVNAFCRREFGDQLEHMDFDYQDKSHRLWHPLQNVRKEFKQPIMAQAGLFYHYDIVSAAPTLIHQYAQLNGQDEYLFALTQYLADPTRIREQLAQELEMPVRAVKVLINALFCGARIGHNTEFALTKLLANDPARVEFLKQHQYLTQLRMDIRQCWRAISEVMPRTYVETTKGQRRVPLSSRKKWVKYFELERSVLDVVRMYLDQTNNRHFLEHDGWATEREVNLNELKFVIERMTGFQVDISFSTTHHSTYPIVYDLEKGLTNV
jgi:hypothetical protein